jgi:membrane-associated protease RseP (regulator of RpoE activity)
VLYALGDPLSLVLLLLSVLFAVTLHGWVQSLMARRSGDRAVVAERRTGPDPRRHVDPFGAVAAGIAGVGWARPVEPPDRRRRGALVAVLLSGAVANLVVGLAVLVGFRLAGGRVTGTTVQLLQYGVGQGIGGGELLLRVLLMLGLMNVFVGALSLVPLPPLDGGRLLFALAPRSPGWQKAEYQLDERNIGIAVLLALLLIPLGGPQALLPVLLDTVVGPLADLVTGGF